MSKANIPKKTRTLVQKRAKVYCEYCLKPENHSPAPFCIDHIEAESLGGKTSQENLAYSCGGCNAYKHNKVVHFDPFTKERTRLYHPRLDKWHKHFTWNEYTTLIESKTKIGRATIHLLRLNRTGLINMRTILHLVGLHPPTDYP